MEKHDRIITDEETIIFSVRRHWFILARDALSIVITALIPLIVYQFTDSMINTLTGTHSEFMGHVFVSLYTAWLIFMWMALFNMWTNYYLDTWTLTTKRFIATDHRGLFNRTTATFRLERMQDVVITTRGILPTLLKYGTLGIQTAGEEGNFEIYGLANPEGLKSAIIVAAGEASKHTHPGLDGM